jgi:hypothetical protein
MALPNNILQQMLAAAAQAAGAQWGTFSSDVEGFAQQLVQESGQTAADLAAGNITQAQAKVQFDGIADASEMIANYTEESVKLAAQNAVNAAVGVLWTAIAAAVPK